MKKVKGQTKQKSGSKLKGDVKRQCTKPRCSGKTTKSGQNRMEDEDMNVDK